MIGEAPNPFDNPAFSLVEMVGAINRLPYNMYSRTAELNIFREQGVTTNTITLEDQGGTLNLLPSVPRGAPSTVNHSAKRKMRAFVIPHVPLEDVVLPQEVAGQRQFGSVNEFATLQSKMMQKLQEMRNKHDITREWLRVGALKGILYDGDGSTILYNFFTEFNITPFMVNYQFSSATFDVLGTTLNVKRHMEDNLHGEAMTRAYCLCSPTFYDSLTSHPTVQKAYQYYQNQQPLGGDYRTGFRYGEVTFEEYRGNASDLTGVTRKFIADGEAQFFPLGTNTTFWMFNGPGMFNDTVNTEGLPYYARQEPRKFNMGTDVYTETNPFPICVRPELLVRGTSS